MKPISSSSIQVEPLVSVIVPCYNSERTIRDCLSSILRQKTTFHFDVIVVDSSTDSTPEIIEREFKSVRLIHLKERTFAGKARNIGARTTRAEYCLMIDSDCIASADLIEKVIALHGEQRYAAVGGSIKNGTPRSLSGIVGYIIEFKEFIPKAPRRLERSIPTANIAYRRDVLERFGYFDEDMWLAEDILFNWNLYNSGERILFDPVIEVTHINRTGWREVLSYQVSLGKMSAIARRRGNLPGNILLEYPVLIALMPFVRTLRAARWFAFYDKSLFWLFMLIWPLYFLAAGFWSYGFFKGVISKQRKS